MKFLHSPSSTSSSTSDTIRPNYGCFPTVLRRLLCFHTLPTLPFDHHCRNEEEEEEVYGVNEDDEVKGEGNPGIVAKLMGLDSMPMELGKKVKGSCVLEYPSFMEVENDKFIILSFERSGKEKELRLSLTKMKEKIRSKKTQESPICKIQENDDSSELFDSKSGFDKRCKTLCDKRGKLREKLVERIETESDSENSSPVSVLEFSDHQQASHSGKDYSKSKNLNSRRKLRDDLDKNAAPSSLIDDGVESSGIGKKYVNFAVRDFKEMWEEICIMAERDVMDSGRVQKERWKGEDFEEIVACFELQILDHLIHELITTV